jgi:hypothetical protein
MARCARETADPEESALSRALTEECSAGKVVDFDPSRWLMQSQPPRIDCLSAVHQDEGAQAAFSDPVAELQSQNQPYLAPGFEWKRKYERVQEELEKIATQ